MFCKKIYRRQRMIYACCLDVLMISVYTVCIDIFEWDKNED